MDALSRIGKIFRKNAGHLSQLELALSAVLSDDIQQINSLSWRMIAIATFHPDQRALIFMTLWENLENQSKSCWRLLSRTLLLIEYLLLHGDRIAMNRECKMHVLDFRMLHNFETIDSFYGDLGQAVRERADAIVKILQPQATAERAPQEKAKEKRYNTKCVTTTDSKPSICQGEAMVACNLMDEEPFGNDFSIESLVMNYTQQIVSPPFPGYPELSVGIQPAPLPTLAGVPKAKNDPWSKTHLFNLNNLGGNKR